jgi:hypothetical protein
LPIDRYILDTDCDQTPTNAYGLGILSYATPAGRYLTRRRALAREAISELELEIKYSSLEESSKGLERRD